MDRLAHPVMHLQMEYLGSTGDIELSCKVAKDGVLAIHLNSYIDL